jgi:hypothetical protein
MRNSSFLCVCAVAFALVLCAGVRLAWASSPCSGTVKHVPGQPGVYKLHCGGNCSPNPGPCVPGAPSGVGASGATMCVCGDPNGISNPANEPCGMFLNWTTTSGTKVYWLTCWNANCPSPADCDQVPVGIVIDPLTGYLSGTGSVTCPCQ